TEAPRAPRTVARPSGGRFAAPSRALQTRTSAVERPHLVAVALGAPAASMSWPIRCARVANLAGQRGLRRIARYRGPLHEPLVARGIERRRAMEDAAVVPHD